MSNDCVDRPISSVSDVVDACLCADNFSDGYTYLRGLAASLSGGAPSAHQIALCRHLLRWDQDVYELIERVALANALSLEQVLLEAMTRLSAIYEEKHHED